MSTVTLRDAEMSIVSNPAADDGATINLSDKILITGSATGVLDASEGEHIEFGFLQRVDKFSLRKSYSRPGVDGKKLAALTEYVELNNLPMPDRHNRVQGQIFYSDGERSKKTSTYYFKPDDPATVRMHDSPGIEVPIPKQLANGAELALMQYYVEFTSWVGYQVSKCKDSLGRKVPEAQRHKRLVLLREWTHSAHFSYLPGRLTPHMNLVSSEGRTPAPATDELRVFLSQTIRRVIAKREVTNQEWRDYESWVPPPPP